MRFAVGMLALAGLALAGAACSRTPPVDVGKTA
jgi:hypothetical protein